MVTLDFFGFRDNLVIQVLNTDMKTKIYWNLIHCPLLNAINTYPLLQTRFLSYELLSAHQSWAIMAIKTLSETFGLMSYPVTATRIFMKSSGSKIFRMRNRAISLQKPILFLLWTNMWTQRQKCIVAYTVTNEFRWRFIIGQMLVETRLRWTYLRTELPPNSRRRILFPW